MNFTPPNERPFNSATISSMVALGCSLKKFKTLTCDGSKFFWIVESLFWIVLLSFKASFWIVTSLFWVVSLSFKAPFWIVERSLGVLAEKAKDPPWFAVQMGSVADSVAAKIQIIFDNTNFSARKNTTRQKCYLPQQRSMPFLLLLLGDYKSPGVNRSNIFLRRIANPPGRLAGINLFDDGKSMLHPNLNSRNTNIGNQVVT